MMRKLLLLSVVAVAVCTSCRTSKEASSLHRSADTSRAISVETQTFSAETLATSARLYGLHFSVIAPRAPFGADSSTIAPMFLRFGADSAVVGAVRSSVTSSRCDSSRREVASERFAHTFTSSSPARRTWPSVLTWLLTALTGLFCVLTYRARR